MLNRSGSPTKPKVLNRSGTNGDEKVLNCSVDTTTLKVLNRSDCRPREKVLNHSDTKSVESLCTFSDPKSVEWQIGFNTFRALARTTPKVLKPAWVSTLLAPASRAGHSLSFSNETLLSLEPVQSVEPARVSTLKRCLAGRGSGCRQDSRLRRSKFLATPQMSP